MYWLFRNQMDTTEVISLCTVTGAPNEKRKSHSFENLVAHNEEQVQQCVSNYVIIKAFATVTINIATVTTLLP